MRRSLLLLLVACTPASAPVPGAADDTAFRAEVLAAETRLREAMVAGDTVALGTLWAPEYRSTSAVGHASSRTESLMAYGQRLVVVDSAVMADPEVRVYGPAAMVRGTLTWAGRAVGQPFAATASFLHLWARQPDGRWLLVASQMTGQPAAGGRPRG